MLCDAAQGLLQVYLSHMILYIPGSVQPVSVPLRGGVFPHCNISSEFNSGTINTC